MFILSFPMSRNDGQMLIIIPTEGLIRTWLITYDITRNYATEVILQESSNTIYTRLLSCYKISHVFHRENWQTG
jgi:hypothetical protein